MCLCVCVSCRVTSSYLSLTWSEARKVRTSPLSHVLEKARHKQPFDVPGHKIKELPALEDRYVSTILSTEPVLCFRKGSPVYLVIIDDLFLSLFKAVLI